jgi:lipopolysaccharide/colanic/teichoic acid biosynthesis glycosyltransferase
MTGLAQIRGLRGATDTEDDLSSRLQADLEYLAGWSIWRDLRIALATVRVMVHDRAY